MDAVKNPWVGLRPFEASESHLFFGREKESKTLANLVATLPVLIVYAPSGTGKSSLINAGLSPEIWSDEEDVPLVDVEPRADVLLETRAALSGSTWAPQNGVDLAQLLEDHRRETGRRPVIIMDQFEERLNAAAPTQELFASIARVAHSGTDSACVILSIREDYLGGLEPLMRRIPGLMDGSFRVPPLSREALEAAVYGPVQEVGGELSVQDPLVSEVLDDLDQRVRLRQEPGEQRFEPGYFQIVWSTLWEDAAAAATPQLTLEQYKALGGAERILKDFTAKILGALEPALTQMFWAMSRYLVLPTGAKTALTVQDLTELLQPADYLQVRESYAERSWLSQLSQEQREALIRTVLSQLTSSSAPLFQRVIRSDREEFELVHDLLGKILLAWRGDYEAQQQSEFSDRVEGARTSAEQELRRQGPAPPRSRKLEQMFATAAEEAERLSERIEGGSPLALEASLRQDMDSMLTRRAVIDAVTLGMEFDAWYPFSHKWSAAQARLQRALVERALRDGSESTRRVIQEQIPYWMEAGSGLYVSTRPPLAQIAARITIAAVLAAVSVALGFVFIDLVADDLDLHYVGLTLAHVWGLFTLVYFTLVDSLPVTRRALRRALIPTSLVARPSRRLLYAPATWPLPALLASVAGVLGAGSFDAAGWAATAGFNMAILFAAGGMAALTAIAAESSST